MKSNERTIIEHLRDVKLRAKLFENVCESVYEGIVIVDDKAHIVYINEAVREIVELPIEEIIGKYVRDVIPYSRLPITLKTGNIEIGWAQKVLGYKNLGGDNEGIVHRFPLRDNNKIIGAVGVVLYRNLKEVEKIMQRFFLNLKMNKETDIFPRIGAEFSFDNILGESELLKNLKKEAERIAKSNYNVLLKGETGTGKELFAHALHNASALASFPFIRINCAAIPSQLLESELFGHEKGSFTSASQRKRGKFELAQKGTILLDEIAEMDVSLQCKLLRVLEEKRFERVGGTDVIPLDARIISSSNQDLMGLCRAKKFRDDLYYRIATIELEIPPLRQRKGDIVVLVEHFRKKYKIPPFSKRAIQDLSSYDWPGNVREMKNVLKRLSLLTADNVMIDCDDLPEKIRFPKQFDQYEEYIPTENRLHSSETDELRNALIRTGGNKVKAARLLNMSRATLYNKLSRYNIDDV